jgi:hypothetical protein
MLVLIEKKKDSSIVEYPLEDPVSVPAHPGSVYTVIDTLTGAPPEDFEVKKNGADLEVEVEDEVVARVEDFYDTDAQTLFSTDGSFTPPGDMSISGLTADQDVPEADSGAVWDPGQESDSGHSPGILAGLLAVGGGLAAAVAGSGGGSGDASSGSGSSYSVTLGVAAGNFYSTLHVQLYDKDGNLIVETDHDFSSGDFSYNITSGYAGPIFAKVTDLNDVPDYLDETTGAPVDLGSSLTAMTQTDGQSNVSLSVTPLTALAVQLAGIDPDNPSLTEDDLSFNTLVGDLFDVDDITGSLTTTLDADYNNADGLSAGEYYGSILAMLSGVDQITGSVAQTIQKLAEYIASVDNGEGNSGTSLGLTQEGVELLQQGIDQYTDANSGDDNGLSDLLIRPPVIPAAGDGGVSAQEKDAGVIVAVTDVQAGDRVSINWGGQTYDAVISSADVNSIGQAEILIPGQIIDAAGDSRTLAVTYSVNGGNSSPAVIINVDTQVPVITSASIPDAPMAAGDTVTVTITVTDDGGDTYTNLSGTVAGFSLNNLTRVNNTTYTATFTVTDSQPNIAAGDDIPVDITLSDTVGNTSNAYTTAISQGNDSIDSNSFTVTVTDNDTGTATGDVTYTFTFSADATGFTIDDITVSGGTKGAFNTVSASEYTLVVTPAANSHADITVDVAANVATDALGNGNSAATQSVQAVDTKAPSVAITDDTSGTAIGDVTYTFTFDEDVTGFTADDVTVTGGTKGDFTAVSASVYTLVVTPAADSTTNITVDVAAGVAKDAAENSNTIATQSVQSVDTVIPTVAITDDTGGTATGDVTYTFTFSEDVSGFTIDDITVSGGTKGVFSTVSASVYTLVVTPTADSTTNITVDVAANVATDAAGNNNTAATQSVQSVDMALPTINSVSPVDGALSVGSNDNLVITFSENVSVGSGNLVIYKADNSVFETIDVTDGSKVTVSGNQVTINPAGTFANNTGYYVQYPGTAFEDAAGNTAAAISDTTTWNFSTPDSVAPTVQSFSSSTADGSYKEGDTVNITATIDEDVKSGSTLTVTLDTGDQVTLTAASDGNTLTGTYTVGAGDTSSDLAVASFTIGSVQDLSGNSMTDTTVPAGNNISDNKAIAIDTTAPGITSGGTASAIDENSGANQVIYTVAADEAVTYSLKSVDDYTAFSINASTGDVTLTANPDHENQSSYDFTVVATDAAGNYDEQAVSLAINDLDESSPSITSGGTATAIDENSGAGQVIYSVSATDTADTDDATDTSASLTYSLKSVDDYSAFSINASTGDVTLTANPDYETKSSYDFTVVATDNDGNTDEQAVTLAINDVANEVVTTVVVFDLINGQSSDHSSQTFQAGVTYDIYIYVDSNSASVTLSEAWTGGSNLGSDDTIHFAGNGDAANVLGYSGYPVSGSRTGGNVIYWDTTSSNAGYVNRSGLFSRGYSNSDNGVDLWDGTWTANPNYAYTATMPAGILGTQL